MPSRQVTTLPGVTEYPVADGDWDTSRAPINLIVIHTEVGFKKAAEATFDNPQSHVSAHYGVNLDGSYDHFVDEDNTAYHAGDYLVNQRSIGIEHEDGGKYNDPRPDALYTSSAKLVADICKFYGFPADTDHIKPHREVSDAPTACPGALDVGRIIREAAAVLTPAPTPTAPTITDQTKIDMGTGFGLMEVQAIRSSLHDLTAANKSLNAQNGDLSRQLAEARSATVSVPDAPKTPGSIPPPPSPTTQPSGFLQWLAKLLG